MIILTRDQANQVRGFTNGNALAPSPLVDGTFALPGTVLDDPAHQQHRAFLSGLPQRELTRSDFLYSKAGDPIDGTPNTLTADDIALIEACAFAPWWGEQVTV